MVGAKVRRDLRLAWQIANFSRANKLESLDHYLKPLADPEQRRSEGAARVLQLFQRVAKKKAQ